MELEDIKVVFDSADDISTTLDGGTIKFGELEIGTTTTGEEGSEAIVTNSGTSEHAILNFTIPRGKNGEKGDTGASNTLTIGTVTKGEEASANLTGESPNQVLNLVLPKGDKGDAFKYEDFTSEQLDDLKGDDAKINGVNTIEIEAGKNINLEQKDNKLIISSDDTEIPETLYALGADYAEYFEWEDGNPNNEDRTSLFVSIVYGSRKIKKAMEGEDILGITSIDASVIGNAKYKDKKGYSAVGMTGVMKVKDNGVCKIGDYVIPGDNGLAVPSGNDAGYKVTARYSNNLIEVLLAHDAEMISRLDDELKEKATIEDMTDYIEEHKEELKGVDGFSPIATIIETDTGTFIEITDKNGTTSAEIRNGTNGIDGTDGIDGEDGYTPVKGTDYFTEEDKQVIESEVITSLTPTLNNNLKDAKDYTDNAITRDFKDITYDENTATFVFTRHDNTTFTVDLPIEQTVKNGYYDETNKELVLVLVSDQEIRIPATGLIDDYDGVTSATIQCVVSADNKITCNIVSGSISKTLLTTELQQEINNKVNTDTFTTELGKKVNTADVGEKELLITYEDGTTETIKLVIYK